MSASFGLAAEEGPDDERVAWECNLLAGASCTDCAAEVATGVSFVSAAAVGVVACLLFLFFLKEISFRKGLFH